MLGKNISEKISRVLLAAAKTYFQKNLSNFIFPNNINAELYITRDKKHGDLASNIAMNLASYSKCSPVSLGQELIKLFLENTKESGLAEFIERVELQGGFINFWLSDEYYRRLLLSIKKKRFRFGRSDDGAGKYINLEFVSANPTGPLTLAHGRQAAVGDALSRILNFNGYKVTREYYLNDVGRQINLLAESVRARYFNLFGKETPMPEGGYMGEYIIDIAKEIKVKKGDSFLESPDDISREFFLNYAVSYMMTLIRKDLADFGIAFDVWTSQRELEKNGEVEKALNLLEKRGYIYEEGGAKWFASMKLGDDKDRVAVKSDGSYTYLAPDIAYHTNKYKRGYSTLIDLLGPDHHGYIKRMKAAVLALGKPANSLNILIVQLVTLLRAGETVSMSTRQGTFLSLREIMDEIGKDVARFFFLSRRLDSHLDFDIDLAKKESMDNPVFYIQYAYARICSIKKYGRKNRIRLFFSKRNLSLLVSEEEKRLMRKLSEFPFVVKAGADALEPNRIIVYLNELARSFHSFYTECRVISDNMALSKARLCLVDSVRIVLANGLHLLNITIPEKM